MRTSIWFRTEEKQPDKSGYYLSYRGWGIAGKAECDSDHGYVYYDKKKDEWRDYESTSMGHYAIVYYWTDAVPDEWVEDDPPRAQLRNGFKHPVPAVQAAWEEAMKAIANYELVKNLAQ